jgi:threonine/homoserine/homoserine lactone efflux protein
MPVDWFVFSFTVAIAAVVTPGPVSTAAVSLGARQGFIIGPLISTGHSAMELAMVIALALGWSAAMQSPVAIAAIGLVGGALLLWMGGTMVWDAARGRIALPRADADVPMQSNRRVVAAGMLATLSNPFWYAWWVTVGAKFVGQAFAAGLLAIAAFYLGHIAADYAWNSLLAGVVGSGRRWLTDSRYRLLIGVCGLFLLYLGTQFLAVGVGMVSWG